MKNVIALVVVVLLLGGYYVTHKEKVNTWFGQMSQSTGIPFDTISQNTFSQLQDSISKNLTEDKVKEQLGNWVIKDGIALPNDWKLGKTKVVGKTYITIVPPHPASENDYIVFNYPTDKLDKLPQPAVCADNVAVSSRCLVGNNLETMKTFVLMSYIK